MSIAFWAERYVDWLGLKLVPLKGKAPIREAWNADENLIATRAAARAHWSRHPHDNVGVCLEPSNLVSLDADDLEGARLVLAGEGIDIDALISATPTILGRAPRLVFKVPGLILSRKAIVWPPRSPREKPVTVLELRGGRVQDVLPPSIHPDTQKAYRWLTLPLERFPHFPCLPGALLQLWLEFDAFKHRARNLCPWADPEPEAPPAVRHVFREHTGPSVIRAFNEAHDTAALLTAHGYQRVSKNRWKSPNGHGVAGFVLLESGRVYCHHSSDALGDGRARDAFDLYAHFDHGGDVRAAVKEAARMLGLQGRV